MGGHGLYDLCSVPKAPQGLGMYVSPGSLENVFAYLTGLDTATGCLTGFREWLLPRFEDGNNLTWPGVAQMLLASESVAVPERGQSTSKIIRTLSSLQQKALGDCTYSMQSGYPTQFHRINRGCVVRAMLNRNANTAVGMNATVTPVRVIRMRPR